MWQFLASSVLLIGSGIGGYIIWWQGIHVRNPSYGTALDGIPYHLLLVWSVVCYVMAKRSVVGDAYSYLALALALCVSLLEPLGLYLYSEAMRKIDMGGAIGMLTWAIALLASPLLFWLTHVAAKQGRRSARGFPVVSNESRQ